MRLATAFVTPILIWAAACAAPARAQQSPQLHLDHVPVAVRSLDAAAAMYGDRLGFRLKPGREHANGLRNAFAKFPDGSYLELITSTRPSDELSRWYSSFLERQEGGAFLSLRTDSLEALARVFQAHGHPGSLQRYGSAFSILSFSDSPLAPVFLIEYPEPVQDSPALLQHPNTALGLEAVWLSESTFAALAAIPAVFGPARDSTITLARGVISISTQPSGPDIIGVTLRVRDAAAAQAVLRAGTSDELPLRTDTRGLSILVPPRLAHGIWLEFLESRSGTPSPAARDSATQRTRAERPQPDGREPPDP